MDKLKMQTENIVDENVAFIEQRFPNCVIEAKDEQGKITKMVDFDLLKQELSKVVVDGDKERYQMTWPDKKQAILTANSPISKTLRPCKEKSVGFDNTKNIYIEGDNLDVLKLLRETYLGKVKMIYIDPPYNTGNDFVYNDDFATDTDDYLQRSNQVDEEGNRMTVNSDSNGRFHTDWLNMIYPRLKVAKDLLTDDGVIFISIDHNEVNNLVKVGNEVFGEANRLGIISTINNLKGRSDDKFFATCNEFLLVYAKNKEFANVGGFKLEDEELENDYDKQDEIGFYKLIGFRKTGSGWERHNRPFMFYPVLFKNGEFTSISDDEFKLIYNVKSNTFDDDYIKEITQKYTDAGYKVIWPTNENGEYGRWRWGRETFYDQKDYNLEINSSGTLCTKMRATLEDGSLRVKTAKTLWYKPEYDTGSGAKILKNLFEKSSDIFDNPKSLVYIKDIIRIITSKNDIVLDFFSGSATTAHAVMQLNKEDAGKRKFIMVQLPEVCDDKSEAKKVGFNNVCEIGEERIRRAGQKIKDENPMVAQKLDTGFRVFKLDSSNMKDTYYKPSEYNFNLLDALDENIKPDRTPEDLLFQVMLDLGLMLDSKIEEKNMGGKKVFIVGEYNEMVKPDLICCFDSNVDNSTVTEIAKMQPRFAVFRDSSMAKDSVAVNFDQIFETYSPSTTRKVL